MTSQPITHSLDETTLDNLLEGYQLIGYDWRYLFVNSAVVKQSKYSTKEDLLGFTMMEKYPGIEKTELFKALTSCMETRTSMFMENEFIFPDKSKGWFELRIEPVPKGLFILSIDVTERKRGELAKKEYTQGLEEMIYMTSHRVRQPVCNILGILEVLNGTRITKQEFDKVITYLKQGIMSLDILTKELTTFIHEQKIKANYPNNK